jgi:hypothetical protein
MVRGWHRSVATKVTICAATQKHSGRGNTSSQEYLACAIDAYTCVYIYIYIYMDGAGASRHSGGFENPTS